MKAGAPAIAALMLLSAGVASAAESAYRSFFMSAASMEPTVKKGGIVLSRPLETPRPGDIVIVSPGEGRPPWVKRLVGMPGDRVQMRGGQLIINGEALARVDEGPGADGVCWNGGGARRVRETNALGRAYLTYDCGPGGDVDDTGIFVVPEGRYFVLGDNRDNSLDSRVSVEAGGLGMIARKDILGEGESLDPVPASKPAATDTP